MAAGNPLNEELKQEILSIDGVTDVIANRQTLHTTFKGDIQSELLETVRYADRSELCYRLRLHLTEGTMPTDSHSIVISRSIVDSYEDMGVGSTVEISFGEGQSSVPVTISGLFGPGTYTGHGKLLIDGAVAFAPQDLFCELHPEITSFDYSWSIASDPKKADNRKSWLKKYCCQP